METYIQTVKKAQKGNRKAFEKIFMEEQEYLYKMAFLYMKNQQDALDLVQECVMECMTSMESLRKPEYFRTWITSIMIHLAQKEWRRRTRFADQPFDAEKMQQAEGSMISRAVVGGNLDTYMDLYDAIDTLKFPYKAIIIQHYFYGQKLDEISAMLDIPLGTVKSYHGRAKKALRNILKESEDE